VFQNRHKYVCLLCYKISTTTYAPFTETPEVWGSTDIWGVLVSRIGQGNGAGPQIWAVVSTPILDLLRQEGFDTTFKASISNNIISFIGYFFFDDMDLIQTGPNINSICDDILPLMQAALDMWSAGLQVTGGTLVPAKSFWYTINFQWSAGHWRYKQPAPDQELWMADYKKTHLPIQLLGPTEARQTLGIYLAPDGNEKTQTCILIEKTTAWADKARMGHLNRNAAWLNLTTTLLCQINYMLPATNLSPQQCEKIMQPYLQTRLSAARYACSFPRAIVHASLQHFGLGLTGMHTKQGITHLLLLLKHGYQMDDLTGQLIRGSTENMQLELRFPGSLFKLPYNDLQQLATKSWIKAVWQFQQTHNICIEMDIPDQIVTRVNEILIMLAFHAAGFRGNDM